MIVNFVGSPCSGKTTTAAQIFALLKEEGLGVEFVAERARLHIAKERYARGLKPSEPITLCSHDQFDIMINQFTDERVLQQVCGPDMTVLSDSSCLNALLYMGDDYKASNDSTIQMVLESVRQLVSVIYYCLPVPRKFALLDPNRIHDEGESLAIDAKIPAMLEKYVPNIPVVYVGGTITERYKQVTLDLFERIARAGN